ncbi:hypothetical protein DFH28DRAFT_885823 [Melampsora americana]|nr:hypothetical protein DFH28DRAFT_885823 [Melampsora americana]
MNIATPTIPAGTVSQLEALANSFDLLANTQTSESTAVGTQQTTTGPQALNKSLNKRRNTKTTNKNNKKQKTPGDTINIADIQATNKTAMELRCLAEKHARTGMSQEVFQCILKFHEEMETLIAIKALELGTTVSAIEEIFGKYIGVPGGIGSGEAMRALSAKWANMDKQEKQTYRKGSQDTTIAESLDQDLAESDFGVHARIEILQPRTNVLTNPRSPKEHKIAAERLLNETLARCIPVAKTHHFEVAIIAVSTHIAKHHFQITKNTIGLDKAIGIIYGSDGVNAMPVQLQSYLVGKTPIALKTELENTGRKFQTRVVHALSAFLYETTGLKHWPWSNCDKTLAHAGYELKLLPGAKSDIMTLKTNSNSLNQAKLLALEKDLKEHLVQLVPIQRTQAQAIPISHNDQTQIDPHVTQHGNNQSQVNATSDRINSTTLDLNFNESFNRVNTNIIDPCTVDPSLYGNM